MGDGRPWFLWEIKNGKLWTDGRDDHMLARNISGWDVFADFPDLHIRRDATGLDTNRRVQIWARKEEPNGT